MKKSIGCLLVLAALGGEGVYAQPSPLGDKVIIDPGNADRLSQEQLRALFADQHIEFQNYINLIIAKFFQKDRSEDLSAVITRVEKPDYLQVVIDKFSTNVYGRRAIHRLSKSDLGKTINILLKGKQGEPEVEAVRAGALAVLALSAKKTDAQGLRELNLSQKDIGKFLDIIRGTTTAIREGRLAGFGYGVDPINGRAFVTFTGGALGYWDIRNPKDLNLWTGKFNDETSEGISINLRNELFFRKFTTTENGAGIFANVIPKLMDGDEKTTPALAIAFTVLQGTELGRTRFNARISKEASFKLVAKIARYKDNKRLPPYINLAMIQALVHDGINNVSALDKSFSANDVFVIRNKFNEPAPNSRVAIANVMFQSKNPIEDLDILSVIDAANATVDDEIRVAIRKLNETQLAGLYEGANLELTNEMTGRFIDSYKGRLAIKVLKKSTKMDKVRLLLQARERPSLTVARNLTALLLEAGVSYNNLSEIGLSSDDYDRARKIIGAGEEEASRNPEVDVFVDGSGDARLSLLDFSFDIFNSKGNGVDDVVLWNNLGVVADEDKGRGLLIDAKSITILKKVAETRSGSKLLLEAAKRISKAGSKSVTYLVIPVADSEVGRDLLEREPKIIKYQFMKQMAQNKATMSGHGIALYTLAVSMGADNRKDLEKILPKEDVVGIMQGFDELKSGDEKDRKIYELFNLSGSKEDKKALFSKMLRKNQPSKISGDSNAISKGKIKNEMTSEAKPKSREGDRSIKRVESEPLQKVSPPSRYETKK